MNKKIKLIFDLDGIFRNLVTVIEKEYNDGKPIVHWYQRGNNGKILPDIIDEDLEILVKAPKTEYFDIIMQYVSFPIIWTYQPIEWRGFMYRWLDKYMDGKYGVVLLNPKQKYDKLKELKDTYLVEDYPKFPSYEKIILIDRPYNQEVDAPIRIKTPEELEVWLRRNNEK